MRSRAAALLRRAGPLLAAASVAMAASAAIAETPLPPERLRDTGFEAWDAGHYLTAYTRLAQYLERAPQAGDRALAEQRMARAREALMTEAPRQSLVVATLERRREWDHPPERAVARLAARGGQVTVESMRGPGPPGVQWQRAGEAAPDAYAAFIGRLLDAPALRVHLPQQVFDPNLPGPRRGVTLRIEIGGEAWEAQALRGEPLVKLEEAAARALDFARFTPLHMRPVPGSQGGPGSRP